MTDPHIGKTFLNTQECANATGYSLELLLIAKERINALPFDEYVNLSGTNGFHVSARVYWTERLSRWIADNREALEQLPENEDYQYWRLRKMRAAALIDELELEEKYGRVVNKDSVKALLDRIASAQVSLFNGKLRQELPARLNLSPDKIVEIDKVISELFAVMSKGIAQWK